MKNICPVCLEGLVVAVYEETYTFMPNGDESKVTLHEDGPEFLGVRCTACPAKVRDPRDWGLG